MRIVFALLFLSSVLTAEEVLIPCQKTYISPNQMHVTETDLFVEIDETWILPGSIQFDANGYYFDSIRCDEKVPQVWQCQWDLTWNEGWRDYCKICHRLKGTKPQ